MDEYEETGVIGRGAFGRVSLCRRIKDNRQVVIKSIALDALGNRDRQAIVTEVKVLKMLDHPNVIRLYDSFWPDIQY